MYERIRTRNIMKTAPGITSIIMAGGSGTRLWPSSRVSTPKQFLSLLGGESFIQTTARRLASLSGEENVFVVCSEDYRFIAANQITEIFSGRFDRLILEPEGRNTAPAIALTLRYMLDRGAQEEDILFFSPSDHLIRPESAFRGALLEAVPWARDHIITFGIVPSRPETGYGYIELDAPAPPSVRDESGAATRNGEAPLMGNEREHEAEAPLMSAASARNKEAPLDVRSFREKPDSITAARFIQSGNFLWNSGMFMFSIAAIRDALTRHAPALARAIEEMDYAQMVRRYAELPRDSIDYAVMEKAKNILCFPLSLEWSDIGSWDSVYQALPHDAAGNAAAGPVQCLESADCLAIAENRLIALLGVRGLAVIDTSDALLVCRRAGAQRVKELVGELSRACPAITEAHTTTHRPWGSFTVIREGDQYKVKHIIVNPGAHLSLQTHSRRSEHWVVIAGTAEITIGDEKRILNKNESAYVPIAVKHRLANPASLPLEIIEVQNGTYVGEDDITRFDDAYGRS